MTYLTEMLVYRQLIESARVESKEATYLIYISEQKKAGCELHQALVLITVQCCRKCPMQKTHETILAKDAWQPVPIVQAFGNYKSQ